MEDKVIDHLFRYHSGKMVSVLTRIFGLQHLDMIEDAVQDTFVKASISWRQQLPHNPEAWLMQASKNRLLDIFRKIQTEKKHRPLLRQGADAIAINELFLDTEIDDAQLRMIFTACHPKLDPRDRISFALKTVSGFSTREIASALLMKEQSVNKRLHRARQTVRTSGMEFKIPSGNELPDRLESVLEVLYLIFNEGFHSNQQGMLVRKELCIEAMRLCQLVLKNNHTRNSNAYALMALMAFHAARIDTKTNTESALLDLRNQDRSQWHLPYIEMGNTMMYKAVQEEVFSAYHYEAAIAAEHIKAKKFEHTDWRKILKYYQCLYDQHPVPSYVLTMAVVCMQMEEYEASIDYLNLINAKDLNQRAYLYHGAMSDYFRAIDDPSQALVHIDKALDTVNNNLEKDYLKNKKSELLKQLK
ncbi:MAG: RNA polymerase sigma factor [Flavobacteriaceae bacterium]